MLRRLGIHGRDFGKRVVNSNDLDGTSKAVFLLTGTNFTPRSKFNLNKLRLADIYMMDNMKIQTNFFLPSLIIHYMHVIACNPSTSRVFSFLLLLSSIFCYLNVDFSGELKESTSSSHVINDDTIR